MVDDAAVKFCRKLRVYPGTSERVGTGVSDYFLERSEQHGEPVGNGATSATLRPCGDFLYQSRTTYYIYTSRIWERKNLTNEISTKLLTAGTSPTRSGHPQNSQQALAI